MACGWFGFTAIIFHSPSFCALLPAQLWGCQEVGYFWTSEWFDSSRAKSTSSRLTFLMENVTHLYERDVFSVSFHHMGWVSRHREDATLPPFTSPAGGHCFSPSGPDKIKKRFRGVRFHPADTSCVPWMSSSETRLCKTKNGCSCPQLLLLHCILPCLEPVCNPAASP